MEYCLEHRAVLYVLYCYLSACTLAINVLETVDDAVMLVLGVARRCVTTAFVDVMCVGRGGEEVLVNKANRCVL